jgi:hypothetical protein
MTALIDKVFFQELTQRDPSEVYRSVKTIAEQFALDIIYALAVGICERVRGW